MLLGLLAFATVGLFLVVLLVKYMRRSKVRHVEISALQFLPELSEARQSRVRWQVSTPLRSPLFWLRFLILLTLLAILLLDGVLVPTKNAPAFGVLVAVDHSPSMAVGRPTRLQLANEMADKIVQHVTAQGGCSRVVAVPHTTPSNGVGDAGVSPIAMMHALSAALEDGSCHWTHLAVVSDLPKPPFFALSDARGQEVVAEGEALAADPLWFQVGEPEANSALTGADFKAAGLGGDGARLSLNIARFGDANSDLSLVVTGPKGQILSPDAPVDLGKGQEASVSYAVSEPGTYQAELEETGEFALDNRLALSIGAMSVLPIALDSDVSAGPLANLARQMAPVVGAERDDAVRIGLYSDQDGLGERGIYLVRGEAQGVNALGYFQKDSPLLEAVDLDLLEALKPRGLERLPEGFRSVAAGADGKVWIAVRAGAHPAVLMPEPAGGLVNANLADAQHLTWLVAFINAYRFVNQDRQPLLDVSHVDASGARLENLAYESDTAKPLGSNPELDDIQPVSMIGEAQSPLWPWLALVAIILLVAERFVALRLSGGRTA
ncbi:hypothetical protein SAMN04488056_11494 [Cohaesibacter marisflavi]|uniref:N-terminal double-transmembrane domain-containing protein n=1 Tax=Cohaesibacter marisflavi TaxID=655353 RepID=A0A1I5KNF8_9HYPH|nr:hypothetical protein [Cohaesibacter marisflavi]SFO86528.1 hypothetical protein SAMN04488056_11494 [Cohaesibacter marisflavi]